MPDQLLCQIENLGVSIRVAFTAMLLASLLGGCSSEPTLETSLRSSYAAHFDSRRGGPVLSRGQVLERIVKKQQSTKDYRHKVIAQLEGIRDEPSARDAYGKIESLNKNMENELSGNSSNNLTVVMTDQQYEEMFDAIQASNDKFEQETVCQLKQRMIKAASKLGNDPKLRMLAMSEFAPVMMGFESNLSLIERGTNLMIFREFPDELAVIIVLDQPMEGELLTDYLQEKNNFSNAEAKKIDGQLLLRVSPIEDFQQFADSIDIGKVLDKDTDARVIQLEISDADLAKLRAADKERRAEKQRLAKAEQQESLRQKKIEKSGEITEAAQKRNLVLTACLTRLQGIITIQSASEAGKPIEKICDDYRDADKDLRKAQSEYRTEFGSDLATQDESLALRREIETEITRVNSDTKIRAVMTRFFGANLDAKKLLEIEPPFHGYSNPAEDSEHSDFLVANLIDLSVGDFFERKKALERLAEFDPTTVEKRLRNEIARAIRDIAISDEGRQADDALKPLLVWAGKYSVPTLIQLLEIDRLFSMHDDIIRTLAEFPSDQGAQAVAKYVGELREHKIACQTLVAMGSVAEEAVMKIAPSDDADISLAAVFILGEIGTKKSLPLLRKGRSSTNRQIEQAAIFAAKKIVRRTNKDKIKAAKD